MHSAVHCISVKRSASQRSTAQRCAVPFNSVHAVHCEMQCSALHSAVHCIVQSRVRCSSECKPVHYAMQGSGQCIALAVQ